METLLDEILAKQEHEDESLFGDREQPDFEAGSLCLTPCPSPPPSKGQFSAPDGKGQRWFTPAYRQYPANLWHLARVVHDRMFADRADRSASLPTEGQIRYGIREHPCNGHFTSSKPMFMPRFGPDRCTGRGNHYGSIFIPFKFDVTARPDKPSPPKPAGPKKKPKRRQPGKPKPGGGQIQAPTIRSCSEDVKSDVLLSWEMARQLSLNMVDRFKRLAAMPVAERIRAWNDGHEQTYFGRYSHGHFKLVRRRIRMTNNALLGRRLTIGCDESSTTRGCRPRRGGRFTLAFARPGKKTMVLCKPWFELNDLGERSRIIIHEAAHLAWVFNVRHVQKTGEKEALDLAKKSPILARRNADNYAFYAAERIIEIGP